jgi:hypothetical protein
VNCNLPRITYPTLRSLLLLRICEAICLKRDVQVANSSTTDPEFQIKQRNVKLLPASSILKHVKTTTSVVAYSSSIALQLRANPAQISAEITDQIVHFLQNSSDGKIEKLLLRDFTVATTETGRLMFKFSDRAIAIYMQGLLTYCILQPTEAPKEVSFNQKFSGDSKTFLCQYSYARCATLIRLKSIPICIGKSVENDSAIWLKNCKLFLSQEAELLAQIITTVDEWQDKSPLALAIALSEAFQRFYRSCQIVKYDTVNPELAQCRLGLVMITHWLLKQLLENGLGISAPETL